MCIQGTKTSGGGALVALPLRISTYIVSARLRAMGVRELRGGRGKLIKKVLLFISALCLVIASGVAVGARDRTTRDITTGAAETGPSRASTDDTHGPPTGRWATVTQSW